MEFKEDYTIDEELRQWFFDTIDIIRPLTKDYEEYLQRKLRYVEGDLNSFVIRACNQLYLGQSKTTPEKIADLLNRVKNMGYSIGDN